MIASVETMGDRLKVPPGPATQIGRTPVELLTVVNAVAWGIAEYDNSVAGESSVVAPSIRVADFLEGAYAVARYMSGDEPTHPLLAILLRAFQQSGPESIGSGRQEG